MFAFTGELSFFIIFLYLVVSFSFPSRNVPSVQFSSIQLCSFSICHKVGLMVLSSSSFSLTVKVF